MNNFVKLRFDLCCNALYKIIWINIFPSEGSLNRCSKMGLSRETTAQEISLPPSVSQKQS